MQSEANETAYFICPSRPMVAIVAKGVHLAQGQWIRLCSASVTPDFVEELVLDLFPALRGAPLPFRAFLTDLDVVEFEQSSAAGSGIAAGAGG